MTRGCAIENTYVTGKSSKQLWHRIHGQNAAENERIQRSPLKSKQ